MVFDDFRLAAGLGPGPQERVEHGDLRDRRIEDRVHHPEPLPHARYMGAPRCTAA
jgi:hypothetical protein